MSKFNNKNTIRKHGRKISILMSMVLVFSMLFSGASVYAEKISDDSCSHGQLDNIDFDVSQYEAENNRLINLGKNTHPTTRGATSLPISKYYQGGEAWSNDLMKKQNLPIGTYGCTVTSYTMMLYKYGYRLNPGNVNANLDTNACLFQYEGAARDFGLSVKTANTSSVSRSVATNFIKGSIIDGEPVLVGMYKGSETHFVAAYGYSQVGTEEPAIMINDPTRSRNYTRLSQYLNNGWAVNRLVVYQE